MLDRQTVTISDRQFYLDSITSQEARAEFQNAQVIQAQVNEYKTKADIASIALQAVQGKLLSMADQFEEVKSEVK